MNAGEVEITLTEEQRGLAILHSSLRCAHFIDTPAFLLLVGTPGVEHQTVSRLEWSLKLHEDFLTLHPRDIAQVHSAFLAETRMDELLVVDSTEPSGIKAAREGHLQIVAILLSRRGRLRA